MSYLLFVYGSLTTALAHPMGHRLRQEALFIGPARIGGRLYRVGWYPGLRPPESPGEVVHGEVYRLANAEWSLAWLDAYEGIGPGGTAGASGDPYLRAERTVCMADGSQLIAWVYLYQLPLPVDARILDGIWRG